jgi:hypothetical protein
MLSIRFESSLSQDDGDNETIQTKGFGEDEDKDHTNEDSFLLSVSSNTCITNNSNSKTSSL